MSWRFEPNKKLYPHWVLGDDDDDDGHTEYWIVSCLFWLADFNQERIYKLQRGMRLQFIYLFIVHGEKKYK